MRHHVSRANLIDLLAFDNDSFEKVISLATKKKVIFKNTDYVFKPLNEIVSFQSGLWKGEKQPLMKVKVLRNTNFKLNNGHLSYNEVAEIDVEKNLLTSRTLEYGDIILEKSGGSVTQAIGRVVLFDKKDSEVYSYSNFCSRIRVIDKEVVDPIYLWSVLHYFYCEGGTIPLQNGIRLLNLDMYGYSKIKIPLPPKDIQNKIVAEINAIEDNVALSKNLILKSENDIESILSSIVDDTLSLNEIAPFVTKSIKLDDISIDTYVTTDNMLQNKLGIIAFKGVANISSITEYKKNDILISNIRPYLKKIWFADKDGGCSKDVLVFRSSAPDKYNPKYIYYMLRRDTFFDFVMKRIKGIKMPRGNKTEIGKYEIPVPTIQQQHDILSRIEKFENEISNAKTVISQAPQLKQTVLDKYL